MNKGEKFFLTLLLLILLATIILLIFSDNFRNYLKDYLLLVINNIKYIFTKH